MTLKSIIESILFLAGRPVSLAELVKVTGAKKEKIEAMMLEIKTERADSGIVLLEQNEQYLFSTHPENTEIAKTLLNIELREKLTEASLETLAIIVYKQPVSRAEIEAIRGVNSQYSLRILLMRGLIEKSMSGRANIYRTTHEFLQHLGLRSLQELPDFEELTTKVQPPKGFIEEAETRETPNKTEELDEGN